MKRIRERFVPVALNADRLEDDADGRFFKALLTRWPQGLWVVTPGGETLGFHYHQPRPGDSFKRNQARWVEDTAAMLDEAVGRAGPLAVRQVRGGNPFPDRGVGVGKAGGVRVALSVIATRGEKQEGPPVFDSLLLTKDDWAAFAPPDGAALTWAVPPAVAAKFAPMLSPLTDSIFVPRPRDVTAAVKATVLRRAAGEVVVRYDGTWEANFARDGDPKAPVRAEQSGEAIGVFDPETRRCRSLLWVARGTYTKGPGVPPVSTAAVAEWAATE